MKMLLEKVLTGLTTKKSKRGFTLLEMLVSKFTIFAQKNSKLYQ